MDTIKKFNMDTVKARKDGMIKTFTKQKFESMQKNYPNHGWELVSFQKKENVNGVPAEIIEHREKRTEIKSINKIEKATEPLDYIDNIKEKIEMPESVKEIISKQNKKGRKKTKK